MSCKCKQCSDTHTTQEAIEAWENGVRKITVKEIDYMEAKKDGCTAVGRHIVFLNGCNIDCNSDRAEDVISSIVNVLGIPGVTIEYKHIAGAIINEEPASKSIDKWTSGNYLPDDDDNDPIADDTSMTEEPAPPPVFYEDGLDDDEQDFY